MGNKKEELKKQILGLTREDYKEQLFKNLST